MSLTAMPLTSTLTTSASLEEIPVDPNFSSAPFGYYPFDTNVAAEIKRKALDPNHDKGKLLSGSDGIWVWFYNGRIQKSYMDCSAAKRVLNIIYAAGDCSVSIIGRVFERDNQISGYTMPLETVIKAFIPVPYFTQKYVELGSKEERLTLINQLISLVDRLHSRKIIHGDIKTANLLLCSDGELRFIDFDDARFEDENFVRSNIFSAPYASWRRSELSHEPPTYAEDRHAMGMVIYELYTGTAPLSAGVNLEDIYDAQDVWIERSSLGLWPDMSVVDDLAIANLIRECLEGCSPPPAHPLIRRPPEFQCIETFTGFRDCRADPIHAYSQIFHCLDCLVQFSKTSGGCKEKFYRPTVPDLSLSPRCPHCNEGVSWSLL